MSRFSSSMRQRTTPRTSGVPWARRTGYSYRPVAERVSVAARSTAAPTLVHLAEGDAQIEGGAFVRLRLPAGSGDFETRLTAAQARAIAMALLSAVDC
jgi:hypothetical protein